MSEATEQLFGVGLTDAAINPKRLLNPVESNSGEPVWPSGKALGW